MAPVAFRRIRVVNPRKKNRKVLRAASRPSRRKRSTHGLRGGVHSPMSKAKRSRKRRSNPIAHAKRSSRRRHRNPFVASGRKRARRSNGRRHRNPMSLTGGRSVSSILELAIGAGAGAIGTRGLTQLVLRDKNSGPIGYAANVVAALVLSYAGQKVRGTDMASAMLAGGLAATVQRVWDEKVSQVLPAAVAAATGTPTTSVKGLGDVSYSDDGLGRLGALGQYVNATFPSSTESGAYGPSPALPGSTVEMPTAAASW